MNRKKYVWVMVGALALVPISLAFFGVSFLFIKSNPPLFYLFMGLYGASVVCMLLLMILNHKKMVAFEVEQLIRKIQETDFCVHDVSPMETQLEQRLIDREYRKRGEHLFCRKYENDVGDGSVTEYYHVAILRACSALEVAEELEKVLKTPENSRWATYHLAFVFVDGNVEECLQAVKKYVVDTLIDGKNPFYRRKMFLSPLVISQGKVYYLKVKGFFGAYGIGLKEGLRILKLKK